MIGKTKPENVCSIICGAPCGVYLPRVEGFIIAADSGLDRCKAVGIVPDIAAGDFDSAESDVPSGTERIAVPSEKDYTDAELAANAAIERGFEELRFFCALGGRFDHSVANIQLMYALKKRGLKAQVYGEDCAAFFIIDESAAIPKFGGYLSVFAYDESVEVTEKGVKYETERVVFKNDSTLGVSNEITAERAEITVRGGAALIILTELKG